MRVSLGIALGALIAVLMAMALPNGSSLTPANANEIVKRDNRLILGPADAGEAVSLHLVPPQTTSILDVRHKLRHGEFVWDDENVPPGRIVVWVDLGRQLVSVYRGGNEIGSAVILYGAEGKDTPLGPHPILAKFADHRSATYDNAPMPFTLRLTNDGVAIHGSTIRAGSATHGCVGVPLEFAEKLFQQASVGDIVQIVKSINPPEADNA